MKILLLEDVKGQGKKGQVLEVNDGYARNFLIHKKLAIAATSNTINELEQKRAAEIKQRAVEKQAAIELLNKLNGTTIKVQVKCGDNGKIFGSVTTKELSQVLEKSGFPVDRKMIMLKEPIKAIGRTMIDVKVYFDMVARVNVVVEPIEAIKN